MCYSAKYFVLSTLCFSITVLSPKADLFLLKFFFVVRFFVEFSLFDVIAVRVAAAFN